MRKQADGKIRRSWKEWERIFERFQSSGMTGTAFCRQEKIAKGSFEKWKKKIDRASKTVAVAPTFVEWPSTVDPVSASNMTSPALSSGELELSLPGGVVLRWKPQRVWFADEPRRIFAYTEPTDMRKSFQGLLALVQDVFRDQDPYSGALYLFVNRRGNYVKILAWDRTGFALFAKRLEKGRFLFPSAEPSQELSKKTLRFLLDGIPLGGRHRVV